VLFVSAGKVIVGIVFWDNADASADIAVACANTVEGTIGVSSDGEYRRHFCDVVERLACCVSGIEQFSSPAEEPFSCVSEVVDADVTDLLGANGLAAAVSLDCMALEGVGVGVGDVDGVSVGMADGLVRLGVARLLVSGVVVGVAFALAFKRLSIAAFSVSTLSGWVIETTIFPV